jgi:hypothetical protein
MQRTGFYIFFIFLILFIFIPLAAHAEITVETSLSAQSFPVDGTARLTITVSGTRSADIRMVKVDGLHFASRGQSSQVNIMNGNYSSSVSNAFIIQALKPGTYTIPPLSITAGKKTLQTETITFEVTPIGQNQPSSRGNKNSSINEDEIAFIRLTKISKHYSGEVVPITIKAYFNQKYRANINSLPVLKTDGVVMSPLSNQPGQTQEELKGQPYSVLTWNTTLSGIKTGNHPIRLELDATLNIPQQRRMSPFGGSSLFDDSFLNSFFGRLQQKPIKVVSRELHFEVTELPTTDQPENFTGAIGDFRLTTSASPGQVEIGEPITLTIEIEGKGNFDRVEPPAFPTTPDWKTYSPTSDYSSEGNAFSGKKIFEQAIVAKSSTLKQIPSLSFSYFDPQKGHYKTINSVPIAIKINEPDVPANQQKMIRAAATSNNVQPVSPVVPVPGISGLAPLHLETGKFHQRIIPLYKRIWFLCGVGCCVLLLLFVLFSNMHTRNLAKHPELQLQKKRSQLLAGSLSKILEAKNSVDGPLFLALCRQSIQQQLGLLWNVEGAAISLADIKNRLDNQTALKEIFQAAEQAAYSTTALPPETMQIYFEQMKKELEELI